MFIFDYFEGYAIIQAVKLSILGNVLSLLVSENAPLALLRPPVSHSASAFSGFGDDESGFYQTYTRAFQGVWEAERDWGQVSSDGSGWGQGDAPELGWGSDSYETADAFYSSWSGFVSGLSFGWVDEYNVNEVRPE